MATRDSGGQQRQTRRTNEAEKTAPEHGGGGSHERKEKLDDDVDAILDEIDEVLESNAEDFVRSFRRAVSDHRSGRRRSALRPPSRRQGTRRSRTSLRRTHLSCFRVAYPTLKPVTVEAPHGTTIVADHLPGRRRDGGRPAGDDGQHHRPARHREGVPGR